MKEVVQADTETPTATPAYAKHPLLSLPLGIKESTFEPVASSRVEITCHTVCHLAVYQLLCCRDAGGHHGERVDDIKESSCLLEASLEEVGTHTHAHAHTCVMSTHAMLNGMTGEAMTSSAH